jgi:predicted ATPase
MYISRLFLKNWKNFQKVDVELQLRTFIIGPNASGKSNLLDALRFLRDLTKTGGGLQYAVNTVRGGVSKIRCLSARSQPDIEVGIEIADEISKKVIWKYRLLFNQVGGGVRDLHAIIKQEQAWNEKQELVLDRDEKKHKEDERLVQYTHLEQPTSNQLFRPIADFLSEIQYLHLIPHLVRNSRQIIMPEEQADYFGKDLIERINKLNKRTQESFFKRIETSLNKAVPHLKELTLIKDDNGIPHLQANYEHWRPKGAKQWEGQFSDGTLRLIGLLWALMNGTKPLLLEEPELSLHSAIVSKLTEIIAHLQKRKKGARQVILSTHSFEMLNNKGISGEETILLIPKHEGTEAKTASSDKEIKALLNGGMSVAEAVVPLSAPENIEQLTFLKELGI